MNRTLVNCLTQLGCNDKHIRFYVANLQLGAAPLSDIVKHARLQRSTGYVIASEMLELGLAEEDHKTYKKLFVAAEPDVLLRKLEAKHRRLGRDSIAFKEILPSLRAEHHATKTRPQVRTFEEKSGLVSVWRDVLQEQQEVLLWSNQSTEQLIFDSEMHELFIKERLAKRIPIRVLAVNNEHGRKLLQTDAESLRQTKLLPADVQFTGETYIYGNKVAILDFGKKIFGVITENEQIAESQRAIFNLAWQTNSAPELQ
jgi:sugar-specific transcriptional regulator TrmB